MRDFLLILALCNAAVPELQNNEIIYQAQSPDEVALVETAANNGYVLIRRSNDELVLKIDGKEFTYKLLAIMEFTSSRRRMSSVIETPEGRIFILTKGADIIIYERLKNSDDEKELRSVTLEHLKIYSREGLRTLVCAHRELSRAEYDDWSRKYHLAITSVGADRDQRVEDACNLIENNLSLVGATAIEDKLQDDVPDTIFYLLEAGIKLWVLTGDKQETAINIGYSSKLLQPDNMELVIINAETSEACGKLLEENLNKLKEILPPPKKKQGAKESPWVRALFTSSEFVLTDENDIELPDSKTKTGGLVIDGYSLEFALDDHMSKFLELCELCRSVICCRVTPLQKALVVRAVKQNQNRVSLAIGDGANDVSMIQEGTQFHIFFHF